MPKRGIRKGKFSCSALLEEEQFMKLKEVTATEEFSSVTAVICHGIDLVYEEVQRAKQKVPT